MERDTKYIIIELNGPLYYFEIRINECIIIR